MQVSWKVWAHGLYGIILLHNVFLFDMYVHETHTVGIFTIQYIWLNQYDCHIRKLNHCYNNILVIQLLID